MQHRCSIKQSVPLAERLAEMAKRLHEKANALPPGVQRDHAIRQARQAETGCHISEWLNSQGLQAPK
jgi:hypothetical protein